MRRLTLALLCSIVAVATVAEAAGGGVAATIPPAGGLTLVRLPLNVRAQSGKVSSVVLHPVFGGASAGGAGAVMAGATSVKPAANGRSGTATGLVVVLVRGSAQARVAAAATVRFTASSGAVVSLSGSPAQVSARVARVGTPHGSVAAVCGPHDNAMIAALHGLAGVLSTNTGLTSSMGLRPADAVIDTADAYCHIPTVKAPSNFLALVAPGYRRPTAKFAVKLTRVVPNSNGVGHVKACVTISTSPSQSGAAVEFHASGHGVGVGADQALTLNGSGTAAARFSLHADGAFRATATVTARNGAQRTTSTTGSFNHNSTAGPVSC